MSSFSPDTSQNVKVNVLEKKKSLNIIFKKKPESFAILDIISDLGEECQQFFFPSLLLKTGIPKRSSRTSYCVYNRSSRRELTG